MTNEVIILAQGSQREDRYARSMQRHRQATTERHANWRLSTAPGACADFRQLAALPACGGVTLLTRTLTQVQRMGIAEVSAISVVASAELVQRWGHREETAGRASGTPPFWLTLAEPGNSSLKGAARYFEFRGDLRPADRTIVLLGDVVYSWKALGLIDGLSHTRGFCGTADLALDRGHLWGVAWSQYRHDAMLASLRDALLRHPPFDDEYAPGQLRRWISGFRRGDLADHVAVLQRSGNYAPVDDYTCDIDQRTQLDAVSELAAADDQAHGLLWTQPTTQEDSMK